MATVKFRFALRSELPEHKSGIPLPQLGKVAEQAAKFFALLGEDVEVDFRADDWIAVSPRPGSFAFDVVNVRHVEEKKARRYRAAVRRVARYRPKRSKPPKDIRRETLVQFAKIGTDLKEGQAVEIRVYEESRHPKVVGELSSAASRRIIESLAEEVRYYGSVQGRVYGLNIGQTPHYFVLRELSTSSLIRCEFKADLYDLVFSLFRRIGSVALVSGWASASRETQSIIRIAAEQIEECGDLGLDDFESFFGSAPQLTGNLSTDEFMDYLRGDEPPPAQ